MLAILSLGDTINKDQLKKDMFSESHDFNDKVNLMSTGSGHDINKPLERQFQPPPNPSDVNVHSNLQSASTSKHFLQIFRWKLLFDGSPSSGSIESFLFRVESMAESNSFPIARMVFDIATLLSKGALEWYWAFRKRYPNSNWEQLKEALKVRYHDRKTDFEVKQSIYARKQRAKETFIEFSSAIQDMAFPLTEPLTSAELYAILRQNMSADLQAHLAGKVFEGPAQLTARIAAIEDTWSRLRQQNDQFKVPRRGISEIVACEKDPNTSTTNSSLNNIYTSPTNMSNHLPNTSHGYNPNMSYMSCCSNQSPYVEALQQNQNVQIARIPVSRPPFMNSSPRPELQPSNTTLGMNPRQYDMCFKCRDFGHFYRECQKPQTDVACYGCGQIGVKRPECFRCSGNQRRGIRTVGNPTTSQNVKPNPTTSNQVTNNPVTDRVTPQK